MKLDTVSVALALLCAFTPAHALLQNETLFERASGGGGKGGGTRAGGGRTGGRLVQAPDLSTLPKANALKKTPTKQDDARFSLGEYVIANPKQLFRTFEEPAEVNFFAQIFTFFAAQPDEELSSDNTYKDQTGSNQPFQKSAQVYKDNQLPLTGQALRFTRAFSDDSADGITTTVSTFHPRQSTGVCGAWSSLADYCSEGGTSCACYSGTYYVPEMWNSLAAGCASFFDPNAVCDPDDYWCSLGEQASTYADWCETESPDGPTARFAQHPNKAVQTSTESDRSEQTDAPAAAPAATTTAPRTTAAPTSTRSTTTPTPTPSSRTSTSTSSTFSTMALPTSTANPSTGSSPSGPRTVQCWLLLSFALPLLYAPV